MIKSPGTFADRELLRLSKEASSKTGSRTLEFVAVASICLTALAAGAHVAKEIMRMFECHPKYREHSEQRDRG